MQKSMWEDSSITRTSLMLTAYGCLQIISTIICKNIVNENADEI